MFFSIRFFSIRLGDVIVFDPVGLKKCWRWFPTTGHLEKQETALDRSWRSSDSFWGEEDQFPTFSGQTFMRMYWKVPFQRTANPTAQELASTNVDRHVLCQPRLGSESPVKFSVEEKLFPARQVGRKDTSTPNLPSSCISSPNTIRPGIGIGRVWRAGVVDLYRGLVEFLLVAVLPHMVSI